MKSKHHGWQKRWAIDHAAGTFTHECGLQVRYIGPNDMQGAAINALEVTRALAVKNGHNAEAMVTRMLREASELLQHGQAARINTKVAIPLPVKSERNLMTDAPEPAQPSQWSRDPPTVPGYYWFRLVRMDGTACEPDILWLVEPGRAFNFGCEHVWNPGRNFVEYSDRIIPPV